MKLVIYKVLDGYNVTSKQNYNAYIMDARKVRHLTNFKTPEDIIDYYCKWFGSKPEDFEIMR